jgi:hypothetical protein
MFTGHKEASMPRISAVTVSFGVALLLCWPVLPNGGKAKKNILQARVPAGEGQYLFETEIVPIQYRMNTVRNKYKMIQIRINNDRANMLRLSRTNDKVEIRLRGNYVPAIVDLSATDPALWDSLESSLRSELAYPPGVDRGEEESVFVFLPRTDTDDVPDAIRYTIAGQSAPVVMRTPSVSKK